MSLESCSVRTVGRTRPARLGVRSRGRERWHTFALHTSVTGTGTAVCPCKEGSTRYSTFGELGAALPLYCIVRSDPIHRRCAINCADHRSRRRCVNWLVWLVWWVESQESCCVIWEEGSRVIVSGSSSILFHAGLADIREIRVRQSYSQRQQICMKSTVSLTKYHSTTVFPFDTSQSCNRCFIKHKPAGTSDLTEWWVLFR